MKEDFRRCFAKGADFGILGRGGIIASSTGQPVEKHFQPVRPHGIRRYGPGRSGQNSLRPAPGGGKRLSRLPDIDEGIRQDAKNVAIHAFYSASHADSLPLD